MRFVDPVFEKKAYEDLETDKHYIIKKNQILHILGE